MAYGIEYRIEEKKQMVGETGVEPAPSWSRTKRATRLRYSPNHQQN